jgi:exodeoxyribonuclease V beta subunit
MSFIPFLAFEASAGSGKTFNLVVRYLSLLFMGEKVESITALTFTNKAANEMRERVIETLRTLQTRGELAEIARVTQRSEAQILAQADQVLENLLRSEMKISTIDTFFGGILRKFALNRGIMPTFSVANTHHEVKFLKRFLAHVEARGEMGTLVHLATLSSKRLEDIFGLLSSLYTKHKEFTSLIPPTPLASTIDLTATIMQTAESLAVLVLSKPLSDRGKKMMLFSSYEELLSKTWVTKPSLNYWDFKKSFDPTMDTLLHTLQESIAAQMQYREAKLLEAFNRILTLYIESRNAMILQNNELTFPAATWRTFFPTI